MEMNNIKKLIRDIDRGTDLEKNLPVYGEILLDTYLNYASVELTLSAYLLSETFSEYSDISEDESRQYDEVMKLMKEGLSEDDSRLTQTISAAGAMRDRITEVMEVYTSYTDRLICYEYVLKRKRLQFTEDKELLENLKAVNEEEFLARWMSFVVGNKDQSIVRDRIQTMMGLLPVHMTKNKLLERVKEALTLYREGDVSALEGFVYMIRSAAMLHRPDDSIISNQEIGSFLKRLEKTDFSRLEAESYGELSEELEKVSEKILRITDFYYSLQKVVNGTMALCLARIHNPEKTEVFETCKNILESVAAGKSGEEELVRLEGKIEVYVEKTSFLEAVLFEVKSSYGGLLGELGLQKQFEDCALIANLLSDSLFIDIDAVNEKAVVDDEMVKRVSAELTGELSEMLGSLERPVKKAVMAAVLEKLPADFSNTKEIETYICTNLFGCQDFSEKGAVLIELEELMDEAVEWRER